jgi:L-glyceraldehyde 3-phosphate reductase
LVQKLVDLDKIAQKRGQSLAQMSLSWILRDSRITSALIGASSVSQLKNSLACLNNLEFSNEELEEIDRLMPA